MFQRLQHQIKYEHLRNHIPRVELAVIQVCKIGMFETCAITYNERSLSLKGGKLY